MFTHAASLRSTKVSAIRRASSTDPAVVITILLSVISNQPSGVYAHQTSTLRNCSAAMLPAVARASCPRRWERKAGQPPGRRHSGQSNQQQFVKVGSFYLQRENFRLTADAKEKFTGKLEENPRDFFWKR